MKTVAVFLLRPASNMYGFPRTSVWNPSSQPDPSNHFGLKTAIR